MILIIGAGISGLTLAYELEKKGIDYLLLESGAIPGGYMKSLHMDNYVLELGPNTVLANDQLKNFFYELGMEEQMLIPEKQSQKRFVLKDGKIRRTPSGPISFLFGNFFSWKTKAAIFKELNLKSKGQEHETLGDFFERRFNKELVDYAVSPLVSGIYAGDPYRLLVEKTFPFLNFHEKNYGSVIKGFIKSNANAPKKESIIFKDGISGLIESISKKVTPIWYKSKVLSIRKNVDGLDVEFFNDQEIKTINVDKVVITSPAFAAAEIVEKFNSNFSDKLKKINYCPMVKVFLGFKKQDINFLPDGYGVLNPECEYQFSLGTIWNSSVNPNASPDDHYLFTIMVGGVGNEGKAHCKDEYIISRVSSEIKRLYKIKVDPDFTYLHRMDKAIPQFDINTVGMDAMADALENDGVFICANWLKGASVSDCIKKAWILSERISEMEFSNV